VVKLALAALAAPLLLAGCSFRAPQIVDYWPGKNDSGVPTNQPIRIGFDRPVDAASVVGRFHLLPMPPISSLDLLPGRLPAAAGKDVAGSPRWEGPARFVFDHPTLEAGRDYQVILDAGFRDLDGNSSWLAHHWLFRTERSPAFVGASPGDGDRAVDPAADLTLTFNRQMDATSAARSITITPATPFTVRQDPADARRLVLVPQSLLGPNRTYTITVTGDLRDADGNRLAAGRLVGFATGPVRALRNTVSFLSQPGAAAGEPGAAVWIVDASRVPRKVADGPVTAYSWSPDGLRLLVGTPENRWWEVPLGGDATLLPFRANWAAELSPPRGIAYLVDGDLYALPPRGSPVLLASGVAEAAVAPNGFRIAYTRAGAGATELDAVDVDIRAHYRLQLEAGTATAIAWSPDGSRLAYLQRAEAAAPASIKVRTLTGTGGVRTVASAEASAPRWDADSRHLVFAANVAGPAGPVSKIFRIDTLNPPGRLAYGLGLPVPLEGANPAPSPDGHQIAFVAERSGRSQVWTMNVDGSGLTQLTNYDPKAYPYSSVAPVWSRS
jgi:hypothetical protein